MKPARFSALWLVCALGLLYHGAAHGQSLLSQEPRHWLASQAAVIPEAEFPLAALTLGDLMQQVDWGLTQGVFDEFHRRLEPELRKAQAQGRDLLAFHQLVLWYMVRAGERDSEPEQLERIARDFVDLYPDSPDFPYVFYVLNLARAKQGKGLVESFFFDEAALASLPPQIQSDFRQLQSEEALRLGNLAGSAAYLLMEMEDPGTLQRFSIDEVLAPFASLSDPEELEAFLDAHTDRPWLDRKMPFLWLQVFLNRGQLHQAQDLIYYIRMERMELLADEYHQLSRSELEVQERLSINSGSIGILLPLGSSSATLRELAGNTLDGVRMVVQFPQSLLTPLGENGNDGPALSGSAGSAEAAPAGPEITLIIRDTANDPNRAAAMVEDLVLREKVIAIIGPIARAESVAAAAKAEELGVPLISFSVTLEIPEQYSNVFRHSKSQEGEVRDLVRYAMDYLQARRFAILYPDTSFGRTQREIFWDEVKGKGGKVVAVADYQPFDRRKNNEANALGLKKIFESFTGIDRRLGARDLDLIKEVGDSGPDPVVDFDAIFLPIGPGGARDLRLIAPYPVTVDAEQAILLGNRFWNDNTVLVAGDGKFDGAVFVDAFDRSKGQFQVEGFFNRHRLMFGHRQRYRSPSYYTGLGFDTAKLLISLLENPAHRGRKELRNALGKMEGFSGVTGWTSFSESGTAIKESMFFRIRGREFIRIRP